MKITPKIAEALVNLRGNSHFATVLEGMAEHEAEETQRCRDGDGPVLYRAQGASKALQWWRDAFRDAPASLEKLKNQSQQPKGQNTP